jgi:hypothetical protein
MNRTFKFIWPFIAVLLTGATSCLHAAEEAKEPMIHTDFMTTMWASPTRGQAAPELYYLSGKEYLPLDYQYKRLGERQAYRGTQTFGIYTKGASANGQVAYQLQANCALPKSDSIFLFVLPQLEAGRFKLAAFDVSIEQIGAGNLLMLNLSDVPVVAEIKGVRGALKPYQTHLFELNVARDPDVPIKIAVHDGEWDVVQDVTTRLANDRPYLVVFHESNSRKKSYRLLFFRTLNTFTQAKPEVTEHE